MPCAAWVLCAGLARAQMPAVHRPTPRDSQELADALPARQEPPVREAMAAERPRGMPDGACLVGFHAGSAQLTPTATRRLDVLAGQAAGASRIRVASFAGRPGARDADRDLARRRAGAVVAYLDMLGIARDRVLVTTARDPDPAMDHEVRVTVVAPDRDGTDGAPPR